MGRGDAWRAWLALKMVRGVGNVQGLNLLRAFGNAEKIFAASRHALECAGVRKDVAAAIRSFKGWGDVEKQLTRLDAVAGRLVTWEDESYPDNLRQIYDAPLFLFARGDLRGDDRMAIAVVGTRSPSGYGRQMARVLSEGLARYGVTIVSGLARGIDAEAHAGALRAGGRTVAVLGSGIDVVYPSEHHRLLMNIAAQGCVISELPMGAAPDGENFPARNRIISGISLGVVVVEAAERSGSLITTQCALDQGREVFAVPGPVGPQSRGTHRLLRQGATLVETAEDVLVETAPHLAAAPPAAPLLVGEESRIYRCLGEAGIEVDRIIETTGLPAQTVLDALLRLELRGLVIQQPGKRFARQGGSQVQDG